jgi:hypothetical protein
LRETGGPLQDFPLRGEPVMGLADPLAAVPVEAVRGRAAPFSARLTAAAADAAALLLLTAVAILAARLATGRTPRLPGLAWTAAFLVMLSLFATVPALLLFGRTIGMALADLSLRSAPPLTGPAALRRWMGTLATAASGGTLLLWTARDAAAPTPADRFSGRPLTLD